MPPEQGNGSQEGQRHSHCHPAGQLGLKPGSFLSSLDLVHPLTVPLHFGVALCGQALAHLWLLLGLQSLPSIQSGPGCLTPFLAVVPGTQAPDLRGGRYTEAWTQENPSLSPGPALPPFPSRTPAAHTLGLQHHCRPGWGKCSEQRYRHHTRVRNGWAPGSYSLSLEETLKPLFTLCRILLSLLAYLQGQGVHYLLRQPSELPACSQTGLTDLNPLLSSLAVCSSRSSSSWDLVHYSKQLVQTRRQFCSLLIVCLNTCLGPHLTLKP